MVISNFLLLPSVFVAFSRLDSFYTISTQRILYVSRLFLVSLVPWIDKPWANTLRENLHDPVRLRYINWGAKERQHTARGGAGWWRSPECGVQGVLGLGRSCQVPRNLRKARASMCRGRAGLCKAAGHPPWRSRGVRGSGNVGMRRTGT